MKKIVLIILFLLFPSLVSGIETKQFFVRTAAAINTTTTLYYHINSGTAGAATEDFRQIPVPGSFTFHNLYVTLSAAPGAGKSVLVTFRVDGAATALTCTISGTDQTCYDVSNSVSVTAAQKVNLEVAPTGTPSAANIDFTLQMTPATAGETILDFSSGSANLTNGGDSYAGINLPGNISTVVTNVQMVMPTSGVIDQLYVDLTVAPGANGGALNELTITVLKNTGSGFSAADLVCVIAEANTTCNNTTNTMSFNAGDLVVIQNSPSAMTSTTTKLRGSVRFTPTNVGEFIISTMNNGDNLNPSTVEYAGFAANAWNATETSIDSISGRAKYKAMYVILDAAPDTGAGTQSYAFNFRQNAGPTSGTVTISESDIAGNLSFSGFLDRGDLIDWESTPSGTPNTSSAGLSLLLDTIRTEIQSSTLQGGTLN